MTMARKKNEMDLAAKRQCGLQMVDLLDTPAAWLPVIDENPLLPGFDPKTIVGWTIVMRFPMYTEDDDDAVPSSFQWFKGTIRKAITRGTKAFEKGYNVDITWDGEKMLQSHTLRAADFCDGSDLPDKLRTPFFRIMKLSEYHKIKKAAWVLEHDNLLRRIEYDEIDETPDGHCGFRVTARQVSVPHRDHWRRAARRNRSCGDS